MNVYQPYALDSGIPLSPVQHGILFHCLYEDANVYISSSTARLVGPLDVEVYSEAWQVVVGRHDSLHAAFILDNTETPVQVFAERAILPIEVCDWRDKSEIEQTEALDLFVRRDRERGFDFTCPPLMRLSIIRFKDEEYRIVWTNHHILMDGWSVQIFLKEVCQAYSDLVQDREPERTPAPSYSDYIAWLDNQDTREAERYWQDRLAGFSGSTPLSFGPAPTAITEYRSDLHAEHDHPFSLDLSVLEAFAHRHRVTVNVLAQAVWAVILGRCARVDDVTFGVVLSGRPVDFPQVESRVGLFTNTLPLRVNLPWTLSTREWLKTLRGQQAELLEHQCSPLAELKHWGGLDGKQALFDSFITFENYPSDITDGASLGPQVRMDHVCCVERPHYALNLQFAAKGKLMLKIIYSVNLFRAATIEQLGRSIETLLRSIVSNPEQPVGSLPLVDPETRHKLLVDWNNAPANFQCDQTLHALISAQARSHPKAVAAVYEDAELTYGELEARSNALAHHLQSLGVGPEVIVGVCFERSLDVLIALLGVLKAGGAYLPLDPGYPADRLAFMVKDAKTGVILTNDAAADRCPPHDGHTVNLDRDQALIRAQKTDRPKDSGGPDNLAYVIYTSGTTGSPKGAQITHRNVMRLFAAAEADFQFGAKDVWTLFHSFAFDFSVWEIFGALTYGGRVVVVPQQVVRSPEHFQALLLREGVTVLNQTPSAFRRLSPPTAAEMDQWKVRCVVFGGEALFTEERPLVERAIGKRQREFAAGRAAARQAISCLGGPNVAIPALRDRSPLWPAGFVGSITHCVGFCCAIAARKGEIAGLGVDAEPIASFFPEVEELLFVKSEQESFAALPPSPAKDLSWAKVAFCAKEAFYKSYFPRTNRYLDFLDVSVKLNVDSSGLNGEFFVDLNAGSAPDDHAASSFCGRWLVGQGLIFAGALVSG